MQGEVSMAKGDRNLRFTARRDKVYAILGRGNVVADSHITVSAKKEQARAL
jgi:hypothetical protein